MLVGYPPERFRHDRGRGVWVLDEEFDAASMLLWIESDSTPDNSAPQGTVLRDVMGRSMARGLPIAGKPLFFARPDGDGSLQIDRIEIGGKLRLLVASEPLLPGHPYTEATQAAPPPLRLSATQVCALPSLGAGTMVATDAGETPVDWLRAGDMVLTRDNGYRPLLWVGQVELVLRPNGSAPFVLPMGAFGIDQPHRALLLTPSHRVLLAAPELHLWFGESEMFASAAQLVPLFDAAPRPCGTSPRLHLLLCAKPEVILAEGLWLETVLATPDFLDLLPTAQRAKLEPMLAGNHHTAARASLGSWEMALLKRPVASRKRLAA